MGKFGYSVPAPRPSMRSMAGASSSSTPVRRRSPFIPTIACPDFNHMVVRGISGYSLHDGWIYYKCNNHGCGCKFWHWELEYVIYLVDENVLQGDSAVEAIGWAEERREELQLRKEEKELLGDGGAAKPKSKEQKLEDEKMMITTEALVDAQKKVQFLLMIIVALLAVVCSTLFLKITDGSSNYHAT